MKDHLLSLSTSMAEVLPGIVSVAAQQRLSVSALKRLCTLGSVVNGEEAKRLGLVARWTLCWVALLSRSLELLHHPL